MVRRPLPGPSRDQRIAPDVAATGGREDESVQLRDVPSAQGDTEATIDDRQQLSLRPDGTGGDDAHLGEARSNLGEQRRHVGLDVEGVR